MKDRIRKYRKKYGLSQSELGEKLGVSGKTVSSWEVGNSEPKMGMIERLAEVFNVSKSDIIDGEYIVANTINIPLYEDIACGELSLLEENIIDIITLPSNILSNDKEYFANYAKGNSMIDRGINDGDLLFFEKTNILENGQVGAFCYENEATCKVFRKTNNGIVLMPANNNFEPIFVTNDNFRIVGKLVYKLSKEY